MKQVAVYTPGAFVRDNKTAVVDDIDIHRERRQWSPLGHYHHPWPVSANTNGSAKATPLIPPFNGHKNITRPSGVFVSWPTGYTYRPEIWKLPPTAPGLNSKRDATVTVTTTKTDTTTVSVGTTTAMTSSVTTVYAASLSTSSASNTTKSGVMVSVTTTKTITATSSPCRGHESSNSTASTTAASTAIIPFPTNTFHPIPSSAPTQQFVRRGYYNAEKHEAKGVMFLGNYGSQGSGVWTP